MVYTENNMQQGNSNTAETFVVSIPLLDNEELDEELDAFHDANIDQFSKCSEVLSKYQNTSCQLQLMKRSSNSMIKI
jgi:hypothetical protein